jgi:hypothetical protein
MAELRLVLGPLFALVALALIGTYVPLPIVASTALALMGVGLLFGVPSGLYFHVLLHRALARLGAVPRGWYWNPTRHYEALDEQTARPMRPYLVAGALSFGLIVLGLLLSIAALFFWFRGQRDAFT